jgi:hypothetical protein
MDETKMEHLVEKLIVATRMFDASRTAVIDSQRSLNEARKAVKDTNLLHEMRTKVHEKSVTALIDIGTKIVEIKSGIKPPEELKSEPSEKLELPHLVTMKP